MVGFTVHDPRRALILLGLATLTSLLWLGAALLYHATRPSFGPATVIIPGETPRQFPYPFLWEKAPRTTFILKQNLQLSRWSPTLFAFYPQDFLWAIKVNGHELHAAALPLSAASHEGRSIDLAPFLHPGANEIELPMEVRWGEARFQMGVSPWNKYSLIPLALISCATCGTAAFFFILYRTTILRAEIALILAGLVLRSIYLLGTPYFVRSFDYWGHADYLDYVIQHLRLPPPGANWEAFQPPLYYFLVGGVTRLGLALGISEDQRYVLWQGFSLIFSIGVLLIGYGIAHILYNNDARRRLYLLAVVAVAPPLIFNAARVSNDSLLTLLEFLWLALLLAWWRHPARATWAWLATVTGLALLTKANALALVGISFICLFLDPRMEMRKKFSFLALFLIISCAIAGWYYMPRALHTSGVGVYVAGNIPSLMARAHIHGVLLKSLVFNPFKIIRYPFDEPWGPRHDYFLEVFFKTIFLGEWIAGPFYKILARMMMIVSLLLLPPFLLGLYHALKQRAAAEVPLLITLATVFLAHWIFLQAAPFLSTQDFRYSVILLVPMTYFLLKGIDICPPPWQSTATFMLQLSVLNSAIYLVTLSLGD